jgi:hypothetical protein
MNRLLIVFCAFVGVMFGQDPPKAMTRVEVTFHSPDVPQGASPLSRRSSIAPETDTVASKRLLIPSTISTI